jgi:hypothetical protein
MVQVDCSHLDSGILAHAFSELPEFGGLGHLHDHAVNCLVKAVGYYVEAFLDREIVVIHTKLGVQIFKVLVTLGLCHLGLLKQLVKSLLVGCRSLAFSQEHQKLLMILVLYYKLKSELLEMISKHN